MQLVLKLFLSQTQICDSHLAFSKSINKQMFTDELLNNMCDLSTQCEINKTHLPDT